MTSELKITGIGNSVGLILPKDILVKLRVSKGDSVFAIETPDGIEISAFDPMVSRQLNAAAVVMKKRREVLRKLAE